VISTPAPATPELPEFHVFQRNAGSRRHAQPVAGVDERVGAGGIDPPRPAGGEQHRARMHDRDFAGFHFHRGHAQHLPGGIADQVQRHPFDEKVGVGAQVALVERVQHGVAGAVGGAATALHRTLAEVLRMSAEGPLINRAVVVAVEGHAEVLQFQHHLRRLAAEEFDRVLVAQIIRTLDGVVHVPEPVVLAHVAQRRADPALRRDGVRAGRKHLRQHRYPVSGLRELQRGAHPGATRTDDHRIELSYRNRHAQRLHRICIAQPA
jgi:hypothetical protein